jgi:CIC family chloride channel protein
MPSTVARHDPWVSRRVSQQVTRWIDQRGVPESVLIMATALAVGVGAGLGAVAFRWLIQSVTRLAFDPAGLFQAIAPYHVLLLPALGGLVVGPLVSRFAREAKGHGVPEIMEAVALRGGRIRPRVAVVKSLASAVCIGSGGSSGQEGPIAQIGAAIGSTVGQLLNLSDERIRNLVACGAAGGIAAIFNAPIAGSIFALEVILGQFQATYFGAVVISAVTSAVVAHCFEGNVSAFSIPSYTLVSPWELALYTLMGILAAMVGVGFSRLLYLTEDVSDTIRLPEYVKPALGGLLLGLIGMVTFKDGEVPRIFGVGYGSINAALFGQLALHVALILLLLKAVATSLTLGSGGSGGIFAPLLFMGAMLGNAFGMTVHRFFPTSTAPAGAYSLVGMAAVFGGAAQAPATAILFVFEMTRDYRIILPLMLATVMSTLVSRILSRESIYTLKLTRRGVHLQQGQDIDVMQTVTVGETMSVEVDSVPLEMPLEELAAEFGRTHHHGFPMVDGDGLLVGVVSLRDLERAVVNGAIAGKEVADIATTCDLLVAQPDEPMWQALQRMGARDLSRLPVVAEKGSRQLVGIVRRRDIIRAYQQAIVKRAHHQHRIETLRQGRLDGAGFAHLMVSPGAPAAGQRVSEIALPPDCLIVSVRRGRKMHVAHGYTVLQAGDRVTVFADNSCLPDIEHQLTAIPAVGQPERGKARHREWVIPAGATCVGLSVRDLGLPPAVILVSVRRHDQVVVPRGDTQLQAGDVVEIFGLEDELDLAEGCLQ